MENATFFHTLLEDLCKDEERGRRSVCMCQKDVQVEITMEEKPSTNLVKSMDWLTEGILLPCVATFGVIG